MSDADQSDQPAVVVERDGGVAWLALNRPATGNAFDRDLLQSLLAHVELLAAEHATRVVVLSGRGDAFCSGANLQELRDMDASQGAAWTLLGHRLTDAIAAVPQPTIAVLNGIAAGCGFELALACDLRLMAEGALVGQADTGLGLMPGWGGPYRLARMVGPSVAKELIFTGRMVDAATALRLGLVNAIYPSARLWEEAQSLALSLATRSPVALQATKQAIDLGLGLNALEAQQAEVELFQRAFTGADRTEGLSASLEHRPPRFTGM